MTESSETEPSAKKRRPGRPANPLTTEDPKRPIDIRQSTYRELVKLKSHLSEHNERKMTYDDLIRYLLSLLGCVAVIAPLF